MVEGRGVGVAEFRHSTLCFVRGRVIRRNVSLGDLLLDLLHLRLREVIQADLRCVKDADERDDLSERSCFLSHPGRKASLSTHQ